MAPFSIICCAPSSMYTSAGHPQHDGIAWACIHRWPPCRWVPMGGAYYSMHACTGFYSKIFWTWKLRLCQKKPCQVHAISQLHDASRPQVGLTSVSVPAINGIFTACKCTHACQRLIDVSSHGKLCQGYPPQPKTKSSYTTIPVAVSINFTSLASQARSGKQFQINYMDLRAHTCTQACAVLQGQKRKNKEIGHHRSLGQWAGTTCVVQLACVEGRGAFNAGFHCSM